jgi:hypothetical protein
MTMLDSQDLTQLSRWCAARAISWQPLLRGGNAAVLLEPRGRRQCFQRILLTQDEEDFALATEAGEMLACASDLHSVLDALEGGVADVAALPAPELRIGAMVI